MEYSRLFLICGVARRIRFGSYHINEASLAQIVFPYLKELIAANVQIIRHDSWFLVKYVTCKVYSESKHSLP